ncbi:MAG: hypothetical protein ACR2QK_00035 [Acidimicrobiales bacterium]
MNRLLAPPNGAHLVMAFIALAARMLLGGIPIIGGLISFVLLLVILYHLARVAMNMIRMSPSRA